jgi:O-antigen ligase
MLNTCGHKPVFAFSHAHNAWINLALSIGWIGAVLFLYLFLSFVREGFKSLKDPASTPVSFAVILLAVFWMLRGLSDAVYQEHYLQMQAFILLYLSVKNKLIGYN